MLRCYVLGSNLTGAGGSMPLGWDISAASAAQSPGIPASTVPQLDSQITCSSRCLGRRFFPFLSSHLPSPPVFPAVPKPVSYVPSHLCLKFILWGKQVLVKVTPLVSEGAGSLPPSAPVSSEALTETNKQTLCEAETKRAHFLFKLRKLQSQKPKEL